MPAFVANARFWLIAGGLAIISGLMLWTYDKGRRDCQAAYEEQYLEMVKRGQELEADRRQVAKDREELFEELRSQANEDPIVTECGIGPARVRRLNSIR